MYTEVLHYTDKRSDKIWGYSLTTEHCIVFYGKRKGTLSFIEHFHRKQATVHMFHVDRSNETSINSLPESAFKARKSKINKGYVPVLENELNEFLPDSFKESLMLATLGMGLREAVS